MCHYTLKWRAAGCFSFACVCMAVCVCVHIWVCLLLMCSYFCLTHNLPWRKRIYKCSSSVIRKKEKGQCVCVFLHTHTLPLLGFITAQWNMKTWFFFCSFLFCWLTLWPLLLLQINYHKILWPFLAQKSKSQAKQAQLLIFVHYHRYILFSCLWIY